jgi:HSP20 family protein
MAMNSMTVWNPFEEIRSMRDSLNKLFESSLFDSPAAWQSGSWSFPMDVVEKEEEFVVKASLPGIKLEDLDITLSGTTLTIQGEVTSDHEEKTQYHLRERFYGKFLRSLTLPMGLKADDIQAEYKDGELVLRIPKADEVKPKRIAVQSGGSQKMIEGHFQTGSGNGK